MSFPDSFASHLEKSFKSFKGLATVVVVVCCFSTIVVVIIAIAGFVFRVRREV